MLMLFFHTMFYQKQLVIVSDQVVSCLWLTSALFHSFSLEMTLLASQPKSLESSPASATTTEDPEQRMLEKRLKVIEELLQTEHDYLKDLQMCVKEIIQPLQMKQARTLQQAWIMYLCYENHSNTNLKNPRPVGPEYWFWWSLWKHQLCNWPFPSTLQDPPGYWLNRLEQKNPQTHIIDSDKYPDCCFTILILIRSGQVFLDFKGELEEVYKIYCQNHDDAISLLETYEKDENIQKHVLECLEKLR